MSRLPRDGYLVAGVSRREAVGTWEQALRASLASLADAALEEFLRPAGAPSDAIECHATLESERSARALKIVLRIETATPDMLAEMDALP